MNRLDVEFYAKASTSLACHVGNVMADQSFLICLVGLADSDQKGRWWTGAWLVDHDGTINRMQHLQTGTTFEHCCMLRDLFFDWYKTDHHLARFYFDGECLDKFKTDGETNALFKNVHKPIDWRRLGLQTI